MATKAAKKESATTRNIEKAHIKRKGRHAKKKKSKTKTSKNYAKPYCGGGRG